ncbi:Putative gag protein [Arachis hypogaea]|nr:Putative gag protein [Arachis hypogaea]
MKTKIPKDFKLLDMTLYDSTSDPNHHLSNFKSRMYLTDASDAVRCKAFPTTLTKTAIRWFDSLPPKSISGFDDLARFSIQKDKAKHAPSLLGIKQGDRESFRNYMERFNKTCIDIQNLPTEAAIMGLINGL